jgi:hypothetical protein
MLPCTRNGQPNGLSLLQQALRHVAKDARVFSFTVMRGPLVFGLDPRINPRI